MNILVTAGATREPLDAVRFFSNVSTGSTGAALADALAAHNHRVTLLRGESAVAPRSACEVEVFTSTEDLWVRLQRRLEGGTFDALIMCAAVADYRPDRTAAGKIGSDAAELTIRFVRNPKILPQLKSFSARPLVVVGFKLSVCADAASCRAAVAAQFAAGTVDAVVHNDLEEIRASSAHPFWLYRSATAVPEQINGAQALAEVLDRLVATSVSERTKANSLSR